MSTITSPGEEPFRAQLVLAEEDTSRPGGPGEGVAVRAISRLEGEAPVVFEPMHPLADEAGYIQLPLVDLPGQLVDLVLASRTYQVNLSVMQQSREAYQAAMQLGR